MTPPLLRYWCAAHKREATERQKDGSYQCYTGLGGLLCRCSVEPMQYLMTDDGDIIPMSEWDDRGIKWAERERELRIRNGDLYTL